MSAPAYHDHAVPRSRAEIAATLRAMPAAELARGLRRLLHAPRVSAPPAPAPKLRLPDRVAAALGGGKERTAQQLAEAIGEHPASVQGALRVLQAERRAVQLPGSPYKPTYWRLLP